MPRTKIVCTLGPATCSLEKITALIGAGMNVARLNFSHGTHEEHAETIERVRAAAKAANKAIAILQDLQGPKIRVGKLEGGAIQLIPGNTLTIVTEEIVGTQAKISTTYENFVQDVKPGQIILLDDGLMKIRVDSLANGEVATTILDGGTLLEHKGINLPSTKLSVPSLMNKDIADLEFGVSQNVDYIALSFVRTAQNVFDLRAHIKSLGADIPIVAKIEKPEAITNIDAIIHAADVIMVARGDLGVEIPAQNVPMIQKEIIFKCNEQGVPVITATQMLESMVQNPRPTRAEASDVANAVLDGTDAVMLSEETAVGNHPIEAVSTMVDICTQAEKAIVRQNGTSKYPSHHVKAEQAIAHSACTLADSLKASAILSLTHSGATARLLSRERPTAKIIAVTHSEVAVRRTCLYWGVESILIDKFQDTDSTLETMQSTAINNGVLRAGDMVVMTGGHPLTQHAKTNFIKAAKI